jgi:hypothetical protein
VDPAIVPGVFFANRPIVVEDPHIVDVPSSILQVFGHKPPKHMQGRMLFAEKGQVGSVSGPVDPHRLPQSGSAPGARIFPEAGDA